ncbi:MAG: hypothetical protein IPP96_15595 [Chitinophagaceae bacterium]|nr:hypothetical protein [Chitinophagaceae bacterium]
MKFSLIPICCCLLFSCSDSFINHELKFEKAGDCTGVPKPVKVISNINGERYEFTSCMDDGFDGKNYKVERKGDSILVSFPMTTGKPHAQYKLVLDIDAKPTYHHIILDGQELTIVPSER